MLRKQSKQQLPYGKFAKTGKEISIRGWRIESRLLRGHLVFPVRQTGNNIAVPCLPRSQTRIVIQGVPKAILESLSLRIFPPQTLGARVVCDRRYVAAQVRNRSCFRVAVQFTQAM